MTTSREVGGFEAEMLRAYVGTVDQMRERIEAAGLRAEPPRLRRWNEDESGAYGSEIEMSLLRDGEVDEPLDVLLYLGGERQELTADELTLWLVEQIEGCLSEREA